MKATETNMCENQLYESFNGSDESCILEKQKYYLMRLCH